MEFVESIDLFGKELATIPCIRGDGAPTSKTFGKVGCLYMNTVNGDLYKCTAVADGVYTWELLNNVSADDVDAAIKEYYDEYPSINLFDESKATFGTGMAANGKEYTAVSYLLSDYIHVTPGDVITYQVDDTRNSNRVLGDMRWVTAFDSNKAVLPTKGNNTTCKVFTIQEGVAYVRVTMTISNNVSNYAIVHGEEILPYSEYGTRYKLKAEHINEEHIKELTAPESRRVALPSTLYGFVGYPISVYFYNVLDYPLSDVYVRKYGAAAKGKQYADRWEYTPTAAESVAGAIRVYNHDYVKINDFAIPVTVKATSTKSSLKVLVLGDSTVNHGIETQKMLDLATADGYDLTLIGTNGTAPNNHEGRGGWTAERYVTIASGNPFYNPNTATFDFSYYMTQQGYDGVDCVFLQLGINDVFAAWEIDIEEKVSTYISNMKKIVSSIHAYDSNIKIIINLIIPCGTDQEAFTDAYNLSQTAWRCKKNTYEANIALLDTYKGTSNVYLSHYNAAIDPANLPTDVHPNEAGYNQLGTQMYAYMRAIN